MNAVVSSMYIAQALAKPLLVEPNKAEVILGVLGDKVGMEANGIRTGIPDDLRLEIEDDNGGITANRFIGTYRRETGHYGLSPAKSGVSIISIVGTLVNRGSWIGTHSGAVSYEGLSAQLRDAEADPAIHTVLLDIDSPGGEATGMFMLAQQIRNMSTKVVVYVNDVAASAAYGIASAADEIIVSPTSIVGSIGVVLMHLDRSEEMKQKGVSATLIYAGKHKVDGNPFGALSDEIKADLKRDVMSFYGRFVETVHIGRGEKLTEQAARDTEARTFIGSDAVEKGLADRVASLDEVMSDLIERKPTSGSKPVETNMNANVGGSGTQPEANIDQVKADATTAGAQGERARINAILSLDAAKTRPKLANHLAMNTEHDAETAKGILEASAEEAKPEASQGDKPQTIEERAAAERQLGHNAGGNDGGQDLDYSAMWDKTVNNVNRRKGFKTQAA